MCDGAFVSAKEVEQELKIPRYALYRLVDAKRVPYRDVKTPWRKNRQLQFCVAEVARALGLDATERPPTS